MDEADITLLRPKVRRLAQKLKEECQKAGFQIQIVRGFRSTQEQDELYTQGRTKPGAIVTRKKGRESFHNYGVAFDISPVAKTEEEKLPLYKKAGTIGKELGLEWGGDWKEFVDMPHFYYSAGYSIEDFQNNKVDWNVYA